jgi:hypothetical protein
MYEYEIDWPLVMTIVVISIVFACAVSFEWYGVAAGIVFFCWLSKP